MTDLIVPQPWAALATIGEVRIVATDEPVQRGAPVRIVSSTDQITEMIRAGRYEAWPADPPDGPVHPNHETHRPQRLYDNGRGFDCGWVPLRAGYVVGSGIVAESALIVDGDYDGPPPYIYLAHPARAAVLFAKRGVPAPAGYPHLGGDTYDVSRKLGYGLLVAGKYGTILQQVTPTTTRCPDCWGDGVVHQDGQYRWEIPAGVCDTCRGAGRVDPYPVGSDSQGS